MRLLQVKADMNMMMASEMLDKRGHLPVNKGPCCGVQLVLADLVTDGLQVYMGLPVMVALSIHQGTRFKRAAIPLNGPLCSLGGSLPLKLGHDSELPVTSSDLCKR